MSLSDRRIQCRHFTCMLNLTELPATPYIQSLLSQMKKYRKKKKQNDNDDTKNKAWAVFTTRLFTHAYIKLFCLFFCSLYIFL